MIDRLLRRYDSSAYALLRIVSGFAFAFHGVQKIFGIMTDHQPAFGTQLWIGGLIELVGGGMIGLGVKTVWAAFLASGTMVVAYVQFHWKGQWGEAFFPAMNKGELALIYAFVFLFIATRGPGKWSIERS